MRYFMIVLIFCLFGCDENMFYEPDAGDPDGSADTDSDVDSDCSDDGICDNPPDNFCSEDGTQFIEYTGEATCLDGVCNYSTIVTNCTTDDFEGDCVAESYVGGGPGCTNPCTGVDPEENCSEEQWPYCAGAGLFIPTSWECNPVGMIAMCETHGAYDENCSSEDCVEVENGPDYCAE
jgi:hypothetical protein